MIESRGSSFDPLMLASRDSGDRPLQVETGGGPGSKLVHLRVRIVVINCDVLLSLIYLPLLLPLMITGKEFITNFALITSYLLLMSTF